MEKTTKNKKKHHNLTRKIKQKKRKHPDPISDRFWLKKLQFFTKFEALGPNFVPKVTLQTPSRKHSKIRQFMGRIFENFGSKSAEMLTLPSAFQDVGPESIEMFMFPCVFQRFWVREW